MGFVDILSSCYCEQCVHCSFWSIDYVSWPAMFNPLHSVLKASWFSIHAYAYMQTLECCMPNDYTYCLKGEASFTLRYWLCSTHYTMVRIKNCLKSTWIVTMRITDDLRFKLREARHVLLPNWHHSCSATAFDIMFVHYYTLNIATL